MKLYIQVFVLVILVCSCSMSKQNISQFSENNKQLQKINAKLSDFYIGKDISDYNISSHYSIIIDKNDINEYFLIVDDGIVYKIVYSKKNIVNYIVIDDLYLKKFETPEGISIGMTFYDLKKIIPNIKIYEIRGFGYFGQLPSNWKVGFFTGETATEYFPKDDDVIKNIFQGGYNLNEWK